MKYLLLVLLLASSAFLQAQERLWVFAGSEYKWQEGEVSASKVALSDRAIARRAKQNIPLRPTDLPVNRAFVQRLRAMGFRIHGTSRWLNAVSVELHEAGEQTARERLTQAGFSIREVESLGINRTENLIPVLEPGPPMASEPPPPNDHWYDYGMGWAQTSLVRGEVLHDSGWDGTGMLIALLDGSFNRAESLGHFTRAFNENRVLATWDFVHGDTNVFRATGTHGMHVWSIVQNQTEGELVGSAPRASFLLLRSEDETSETKVEEDNWIMAAEFADSAGADVINSSLSYNTFDAPDPSYTTADMDGRTAVVTLGAVMAHRTGMIVVLSAGNSGNSPSWPIIGAPADADSVLAVGATDSAGRHASFSSHGPTADGRVKPDVMAMGSQTAYVTPLGTIARGNGTSFSAPVVAGFIACFWMAVPDATNYQVIEWIRKSSHLYAAPTTTMGYGIPNFRIALELAGVISPASDELIAYPNPVENELTIRFPANETAYGTFSYELIDVEGRVVQSDEVPSQPVTRVDLKSGLGNGVYVLRLYRGQEVFSTKIVIAR